MSTFLIILFIIIFVIIVIFLTYICLYNKINDSIIKVNEAENHIDSNLRDKYDLLDRGITLVKNIIDVDEELCKQILKLRSRKISNFDFDRVLVEIYNKFIAIYESNKKVKENDDVYKIIKQIEVIDEELITLRNYYNNNISIYNGMIKKFPTNIVGKIKKYKERLFYSLKDMNDDDYKDFKA